MKNKNNFKVGDSLMIEQAWEDEKGQYHDEPAEINAINQKTGEMDLHFYEASDDVNIFLRKMSFFANDYRLSDLLK